MLVTLIYRMSELLLSILIPVYNEEEFIGTVLERVLAAPLPATPHPQGRELIVVDDASRDGSVESIEEFIAAHPEAPIRLIRHPVNRGKGAAIRTAAEHARGEFSIIQDADLEYDPREYSKLLRPLLEGAADVVYGSRFAFAGERRVLYYWHSIANYLLTTMCNIASDLNLTDMETCYKVFRTSLLQSIPIRSNRFGIEPELTIKVAKRQARIFEVPITYHGRTYEEGKKIGAKDAVNALWVILRFWFSSDIYKDTGDTGPDILDALADANRFNRWMADTIAPHLGPNVLELGAGMGNLTRHLARRRKRYVATDIDREHLARLQARLQHRPNVSTALCDLTRASDFEPFHREMDSVVCLNVLEHVEDDMAGLRNIYSTLRSNGRAIVLVPQGAGVYGTLDEALGHFRRYSRDELASKMKATGFRLEHMLEFNRMTYPGWYVNGRILKKRTFSRFQLLVFDRLVPLWRRIDKSLPWPPTSIIGIGVRDD
jgi:glycosyltransferase involved in cell wall biosynthesis/2-polyprenyl-3-methyl-5-hydroxy-6-metoxy-1,4-benzoquinol methylase